MSEVITAINANPETVESFLKNYEYVIPDYQRPYSWGKDECIKLWDDLTTYYEEKDEEEKPYFLGNVVIYNETGKRFIVDGQQRLITLNLLVRALFEKCQTFKKLERMLYKVDVKTDEVKKPYQIKLEHKVLGDNEQKKLTNTLLGNDNNSNYQENYLIFEKKIEEYFTSSTADQKDDFIIKLITKVIVLPITCTDLESALTIFETINNRGMDLSDADIFKSKLYKYAGEDKDKFIDRWNGLVQNAERAGIELKNAKKPEIELKDIFSHYMHVLRGKEEKVDNLIGLRKFYDQERSQRLRDWEKVMDSLDKLVWGWSYITGKINNAPVNNAPAELLNWCTVMRYYANSLWQYPIMAFLHENIKKYDNNEFKFDKNKELTELFKETARYCYFKYLSDKGGINAIRPAILKIVVEVTKHKSDYKKIYTENINLDFNNKSKGDVKGSLKNFLSTDLKSRSRRICLLNAVLNKQQIRAIPNDFHVEHILPQKWGHYKYKWDDSSYKKYYKLLGNLVPLEKDLNIKASDRFFVDKKTYYNRSNISEVRELGNLNDWTPSECKKRQENTIERLTNFLVG